MIFSRLSLLISLFALMTPASYGQVSLSLSDLINLGLKHSYDQKAAHLDVETSKATEISVSRNQYIPQLSINGSLQKYNYDSLYRKNGVLVSNNGSQPTFGLTLSYNLQNLYNANKAVAHKSIYLSKLRREITKRNIIRQIKIGYYTIVEIQAEVDILKKLIRFFSKVDDVLQKVKKVGVYNEIQREQFKIQQSILRNKLQVRQSHLASAYLQLSLAMNISKEELEHKIPHVKSLPTLSYATAGYSNDELLKKEDSVIMDNLGGSYSLARVQYENYKKGALPQVYIKGMRQLPNMPSSNGHYSAISVGVNFPIDAFFKRSAEKSKLKFKMTKEEALFNKALLNYRNQIRLSKTNLDIYKGQVKHLDEGLYEAQDLFDDAFRFYSQKRINALDVLNISQNYFTASRNVLNNKLQIQIYDTQLEYLLGKDSIR